MGSFGVAGMQLLRRAETFDEERKTLENQITPRARRVAIIIRGLRGSRKHAESRREYAIDKDRRIARPS